MRLSLRAVLIALIGLVAIGGLVTSGVIGTAPERESNQSTVATGFCQSEGVSLLIDYGTQVDRQPTIACSNNFAGTGWELFGATKQSVEGTLEYPTGFVCRINDFPTKTDQPCTTTPTSAEGSWAYYYATSQLGDHWMFSAAGAGMRKPDCGDVDAWVFINSGEKSHEPSIAPDTFKCQK
ncbi:MAG: hypothetical protein ACKOWR_05785 [Micrococcales bacterium]